MSIPTTTYAQGIISARKPVAATEHFPESLRVNFRLLMVAAAVGGIWGLICLVNGLAEVTCIQELGRVLITACTGSI